MPPPCLFYEFKVTFFTFEFVFFGDVMLPFLLRIEPGLAFVTAMGVLQVIVTPQVIFTDEIPTAFQALDL